MSNSSRPYLKIAILALVVATCLGCAGNGADPPARPCHQHPIPPGSECLP